MTDRELYIQRRNLELPKFERVMAALSKDKLDYRPHERSPSAAQILWTLASEHQALCGLLDTGQIVFAGPEPKPYDEMVALFGRSWKQIGDRVAKLDDAGWTKKGQFMMGGKVAGEQPVGQFLWGFLFDAVHHRGQLTTYIRPMGGKVPSVYGPSGDEGPL